MTTPMTLAGKQVLITGASSGIGRAIAVLAGQLGAKVILVARREAELQQTAAQTPAPSVCYSYDLQDIEQIPRLLAEIIATHGPLDGFVHSAGISTTIGLRALRISMVEKSMRVNFYAFLEIMRAITKKGCFNEGLSVVGISSIAALQGNTGKTIYCATKAAMDAAIRCLAKELAPKVIRVNSVAPALIETDIYKSIMGRVEESAKVQEIISRQYLGIGEPLDVANMVVFLLSPAAKFITGATIPLDGGRLSS
ncbi:SDR family NAD(P)-dependent oxidoreductase [Desulfobulbus alkaliphilus]|uniref:SDR family NAD(P)-dependent oxidoreductase n=1 Tax=Desulfobulbus alkaliphilus TaxID=869814 RepID=UPI00196527A9|nr:SDR family oxidoreductase [Desulfobulbus alkaliphilus]MBM9538567.1 SDR family oxidoreductase [Desulfobulbus alkaliphilus]